MAQQVLLYTRALPTRLAVEDAFAAAQSELVRCATPAELMEKLQNSSWDVIVLDSDSSSVPLAKLLPVVQARAEQLGAAVVVLNGQPQPSPPSGGVVLYDRPIRRLTLLGALNRTLLARGKKPLLPTLTAPGPNQRRALRVPLLVPVAYCIPGLDPSWVEGESVEVSTAGARIVAAAELPAISSGQVLNVKNLVTGKQALFHLVWTADEVGGIALGTKADREDLRFWLAS